MGQGQSQATWSQNLGVWALVSQLPVPVVVESVSHIWLCNPMDCSLPSSSVHGIFQAIVREWIAISLSRGSSLPRDWTRVSHILDRRFTIWATREVRGVAQITALHPPSRQSSSMEGKLDNHLPKDEQLRAHLLKSFRHIWVVSHHREFSMMTGIVSYLFAHLQQ